ILNLGPLGDNPSLQPFGLLDTGIRLLSIKDWNELHGVAADLGRRIFGKQT
ncbi:MAG: hypothetical protein JRF33_26590, partial [Deltaproteobacteria bacterium]|nr:hypothetical protein [Deltaproteobacteria bacterium]